MNSAKGLEHARRAVELDPNPNYFDTLAEVYYAPDDTRMGMDICRRMLQKHSGEMLFLERLKRCRERPESVEELE
ncbi:hypothetical protein JXA40_11585 [bacterium]|nr:hypothetical protein [candidate division CSSED10-310 bacterium]